MRPFLVALVLLAGCATSRRASVVMPPPSSRTACVLHCNLAVPDLARGESNVRTAPPGYLACLEACGVSVRDTPCPAETPAPRALPIPPAPPVAPVLRDTFCVDVERDEVSKSTGRPSGHTVATAVWMPTFRAQTACVQGCIEKLPDGFEPAGPLDRPPERYLRCLEGCGVKLEPGKCPPEPPPPEPAPEPPPSCLDVVERG